MGKRLTPLILYRCSVIITVAEALMVLTLCEAPSDYLERNSPQNLNVANTSIFAAWPSEDSLIVPAYAKELLQSL